MTAMPDGSSTTVEILLYGLGLCVTAIVSLCGALFYMLNRSDTLIKEKDDVISQLADAGSKLASQVERSNDLEAERQKMQMLRDRGL
jgi:hypothetical protein